MRTLTASALSVMTSTLSVGPPAALQASKIFAVASATSSVTGTSSWHIVRLYAHYMVKPHTVFPTHRSQSTLFSFTYATIFSQVSCSFARICKESEYMRV